MKTLEIQISENCTVSPFLGRNGRKQVHGVKCANTNCSNYLSTKSKKNRATFTGLCRRCNAKKVAEKSKIKKISNRRKHCVLSITNLLTQTEEGMTSLQLHYKLADIYDKQYILASMQYLSRNNKVTYTFVDQEITTGLGICVKKVKKYQIMEEKKSE